MKSISLERLKMKWVFILIGILYWITESFVEAFILQRGSFISNVFTPELHEIYMRLITAGVLIFALYSRVCVKRINIIATKLREAQERLTLTLDSAHVGTWDWDLVAGKIVLSENHAGLFGLRPDEFDGTYECFERCIHQDDLGALKNAVSLAIQNKTPYQHEYRVVWKDGSIHWIAGKGRVMYDKSGKPVRMSGTVMDITGIKSAEEIIRQSEERYRTLFENSKDAIYITLREGPFIDVNHAVLDLFGYSREEMIGMDVRNIYINPDDRTAFQKEIEEKGHIKDYPIRFKKKDGTEMDCLLTSTLLTDKKGTFVGYQGIMRDITRQIKTEKETAQTLSLLKASLESTADGILVVNREGGIETFNNQFVEMWQIPQQVLESGDDNQALAFVLEQLKEPEDFLRKVRELYAKPGEESLDTLEFRDGRIFERYSKPQKIGEEIVGRVWSFRDITEYKKAEEKLFRITQDWTDTFNTITDMITVHDKDFNIIHANKAAEKILGLPFLKKEARAKCFNYYHGTSAPPEGCPSCPCLQTGKSATFELFEPHLNLFIEIRAIPRFDSSNNLIGLIHVVRDITERKKLEEQLRHAQKMEAIGTLTGGIAHDFNNILSAIIGYGNMLRMKLKESDPLRNYADQVLSSAEKATKLTRGLLAFSRKQTINPRPEDLNDIVRGVEKLIRRVIGEDIEMRTLLSEKPLTVTVDSSQIEQVLINLCTNSRDAMVKGGTLNINTESVEIGEDFLETHHFGKPGRYALVSVTDTGVGMDNDTRERIFEPFFTTKEVGKGTGLGLSIVYGIVKQHNGYILCDSEPGNGTAFTVYLPLLKAEERRDSPGEEALELRGGTETILIAEDEADLRKLMKTVLGEFGYTVIEAADGEEALNKFIENKRHIQLLLLDVIMPKMNGKEVYERIRKLDPQIKALFASGYPADYIRQKDILEEGLHFISKPVSPIELLRKIREILDLSRTAP